MQKQQYTVQHMWIIHDPWLSVENVFLQGLCVVTVVRYRRNMMAVMEHTGNPFKPDTNGNQFISLIDRNSF